MMNRIITGEIKEFVNRYQASTEVQTAWREPLVGFADAHDPLFQELKNLVSPSHALPGDLLKDAKTVISYFIPFDKRIPNSNLKIRYASREWAHAYVETNRLIIEINKYILKNLEQRGFNSVILPPTHNFDKKKLISDWSHKHIAFIAGLGKFGIHHMLITEKGCCGRLGSLITDAELESTKRPEMEFCLNKYNNTCLNCVKNCANGSLLPDSYNRRKCYEFLLENAEIHKDLGLADVCGKCICVVPCSFMNPVEKISPQRRKDAENKDKIFYE